MNAYFSAGRLSEQEKEDILSQHRELYNGYQTMQPKVSNQQPLYVQDFAKDKDGVVLNNKGDIKKYTNVGINEAKEEMLCSECGGMMQEGECSECGYKGQMEGSKNEEMPEGFGKKGNNHELTMNALDDLFDEKSKKKTNKNHINTMKSIEDLFDYDDYSKEEEEDSLMKKGIDSIRKFFTKESATGELDDIYNVKDLDLEDGDFDYVEGGGNDYNTFEKMHHMKKLRSESEEDGVEYGIDDPDNEDDGFEDIQAGEGEMYEQGLTGGGNAPDMDISNIKSAYNFISDGPDEVYPTEGEIEEDDDFETMESAWLYMEDELDEVNDISGVQGIYGDMDPAYDFDSEGPGKAGPYQRSSWNEELEDLDENKKISFFNQKNKIHEMFNRMKVFK
jgi:hypothetical protein